MPNRVKIVVVNETEFGFAATGETDDFVMDTGTLAPGSSLPPLWIKAKETCTFTVMTPIGGPGPVGRLRYEFEALKLRVSIKWADATSTSDAVNPFSCEWRLLDGGIGELDPVPVKLTDERGKDVPVERLAAFHSEDVAKQAKKDKQGNWLNEFKELTATYTLRVKNAQAKAKAPTVTPAVMPSGVVRPTGASKAVIGASYRTWDAPGISNKRKKLLAVIGNRYPQLYMASGNPSGGDPFRSVPYQKMIDWVPGNGTSCTSMNTMLERILTGKRGFWAFAAYHLEEAWVPWGANPAKPMPNVGDIYILYRDIVGDDPKSVYYYPHERHCGVIVRVPDKPGENWITADGGQKEGNGGSAYLVPRPWELREMNPQPTPQKQGVWEKQMKAHAFARPIQGTKYPYLGGGAECQSGDLSDANRLIGWLDFDLVNIKQEAFDAPDNTPQKIRQDKLYTEYDYQFLGAWIDDLLGKRSGALTPWLAHLKDPKSTPPPWQPAASP